MGSVSEVLHPSAKRIALQVSSVNYMRLNTLEKLRDCLRDETPEIVVEKSVAERAIRPIQRMLDISAQLGL